MVFRSLWMPHRPPPEIALEWICRSFRPLPRRKSSVDVEEEEDQMDLQLTYVDSTMTMDLARKHSSRWKASKTMIPILTWTLENLTMKQKWLQPGDRRP